MLRFRRYRVLVVFAFIALFAIYRFTNLNIWESATTGSAVHLKKAGALLPATPAAARVPLQGEQSSWPGDSQTSSLRQPTTTQSFVDRKSTSNVAVESTSSTATPAAAASTSPPLDAIIPTIPQKGSVDLGAGKHNNAPFNDYEASKDQQSLPPVHWSQLPEHFPVPSESVIQLPTDAPKQLPRIQYNFGKETAAERKVRVKRQQYVKDAFRHAWDGYRGYAWLSDELTPVSGSHKNPFCGWAATLVDALDTLWIMGLKEEFSMAVDAVAKIDFTTTSRSDIPLFETTIRYLGGLLSAYDISGQKHVTLKYKAVELAEILMGVFDTPNRMPVAYYQWKPKYVAKPHRASARIVLAEIGTLSVEFTRLAQITGDSKYYDAIARITNELQKWQSRGTKLPGMWPIDIDASGCNKTAANNELYKSMSPEHQEMFSNIIKLHGSSGNADSTPSDEKSNPAEASTDGGPNNSPVKALGFELGLDPNQDKNAILRRQSPSTETGTDPKVQPSIPGEGKCIYQGLTSAPYSKMDAFTLGSTADSFYEYLPKEYMLLGGAVPEYKEMYVKSMETAKEHLLFRPMTFEEHDILVSGTFHTTGDPKDNSDRFDPEGSHLVCFAGGMFAIGSKLFSRPDDLEVARKLTDGCVWAYESTASGIMPEVFTLIPCASKNSCPWNESRWWDALDPPSAWMQREESYRLQNLAFKEHAERRLAAAKENARGNTTVDNSAAEVIKPVAPEKELPLSSSPKALHEDTLENEPALDKRSRRLDDYHTADIPLQLQLPTQTEDMPRIPVGGAFNEADYFPIYSPPPLLTHKEFVEQRIESERIPKGFTRVNDKRYILRPEALESVFIMYRITGDKSWQDKGWKMFQSIQNATVTLYGNSAIADVTSEHPYALNSMESFWLAETLKYAYLLFSEPDLISLDEFVFNTEAHPFLRPKPQ
ncbi:MAG: hypothetical protein M1829_006590 [Trizodia sp. TS-e1964]|nr:MAG: hypothetical protein M1829_006590 [Trizodia sp. TS-e1964]